MAIDNKYFIVNTADVSNYESYIVDKNNIRVSNDGTKSVIKLPYNQVNIPDVFSSLIIYDHTGILIEMEKAEWVSEEI